MEDQLIGQDASLVEAAAQTASATVSVVKTASPITPPNQTQEERWYVLVVTASIRNLNLEMTGVILGDTVTALPRGSTFQNHHMVAVLSRPIQARGAISNQGTIIK